MFEESHSTSLKPLFPSGLRQEQNVKREGAPSNKIGKEFDTRVTVDPTPRGGTKSGRSDLRLFDDKSPSIRTEIRTQGTVAVLSHAEICIWPPKTGYEKASCLKI